MHRVFAAAAAILIGGAAFAQAPSWIFNRPRGFPAPRVPEENAMTPAKVDLGRHLFYDARLSKNLRQSCATCHVQEFAFTDGRGRAIGSTGQTHPRGSMSLANIAYASAFTWGDPSIPSLEAQVEAPLFGTTPIELGWDRPGTELVDRLKAVPEYRVLFGAAFPGENEAISTGNLARGLASFERTILSNRSPYDRYHYGGDDSAISAAAKRGEVLFFSQPLSCFQCHGGFNFSGAVDTEGGGKRTAEFHNTGLYNVAGPYSYPGPNTGIFEKTRDPRDVGKFKAPTLRNIAVTAPYMHDGSIETLDAVLDHYAAGGRTIGSGEFAGIGRDNPNKSPRIAGFKLTLEQKADVIAFLDSLTDEALLKDPALGDPWVRRRNARD